MQEHKKRIYLAGNISADPKTYEWREKVTQLLSENYQIMNPAANQFNKDLLSKGVNDPEKFKKMAIKKSQHILIAKDHQLVQDADIILVNLAINTPDKPLLGTIYELAWAWMYRKPVIAIVGDNWYCKHPFVVSTLSGTADTVEEAVDLIKYFFVD